MKKSENCEKEIKALQYLALNFAVVIAYLEIQKQEEQKEK